jgi:hypothetical protein
VFFSSKKDSDLNDVGGGSIHIRMGGVWLLSSLTMIADSTMNLIHDEKGETIIPAFIEPSIIGLAYTRRILTDPGIILLTLFDIFAGHFSLQGLLINARISNSGAERPAALPLQYIARVVGAPR